MAVTLSRGKKEAISKMTSNLEIEFNKLNIEHKIDFILFKEILFTTKNHKVFLTLGVESEIFNDTKILQIIYPFEKYNIKFINFGNILNLINGFISMYNFLNDESNNKNYKFINEQSKTNHLSIKPHNDNLFAISQNVPVAQTKVGEYKNFLFYYYKSIHGYFLQEEVLKKVYDNLKFTDNFELSDDLTILNDKSNTQILYKQIALSISVDYEAVLKNSSIQLRDNETLRKQLDNLILETR